MLSLVDALLHPRRCYGDCHATLTVARRTRAVEALYVLDDALRGWGFTPLYELHGDLLWREAQQRGDPAYRGVAVRFGECIYRRLVGAMIHECIHASFGDTTKANYGVPFGLPYGVPEAIAERDEEPYLAPFNFDEARAFVGVELVAQRRFGLDWPALNARPWGTYGLTGGNALVPVPRGYRAVAHIDAEHHHTRYIARARRLEEEARTWLTGERLDAVVARIEEAASRGRTTRPRPYPPAGQLAALLPEPVGRNDACPCASGKKVKKCCGEKAASHADALGLSGSR